MQALMGMDVDTMVIALPTALISMYAFLRLQLFLSERRSAYPGLILPVVSFIVSTILAVRPLIIAKPGEFEGLGSFCLRMWITFNVVTIVLIIPYIKSRKTMKAMTDLHADNADKSGGNQL